MSLLALNLAMNEVKKVVDHGDRKHGFNSWETPQNTISASVSRHVAGAERHLYRFANGEPVDEESGLHALAHAAARTLIALELHLRHFPRVPEV